jgi:CRISPR-associated protein Csb1
MEYSRLSRAVDEDAGVRRRQRLQPVGGKGDKVFPPTYPEERRGAGPRHIYERRRIDGTEVWCVVVDSPQSQANKLEEWSLAAAREESIELPYISVDFTGKGLAGIGEITSLDAPHRVYDAILRDSLLDGVPFMKSRLGQRIAGAKANDATALLETSPTALLFGAWHSTGEGGGLGAKFPRCLVSEITGVNVPVDLTDGGNTPSGFLALSGDTLRFVEPKTSGRRTGSRIDPLGILRGVTIYQSADNPRDWTPFEDRAARRPSGNREPIPFSRRRGDRAGRPAVINHGNVTPSVQPLGVTCDYLEHVAVISFSGLRRLRFGSDKATQAGRTLLAGLGLVALAEQDARGYALRSRCDLVCDGRAPMELVHADGTIEQIEIDRSVARSLYADAYREAQLAGFQFPRAPIKLVPQDKLVEIVRLSQGLALAGEGGEEEDE